MIVKSQEKEGKKIPQRKKMASTMANRKSEKDKKYETKRRK